jgi:thiol-disulfide isomerase/thioredoxin
MYAFYASALVLIASTPVLAQSPAAQLWKDLEAKRNRLSSFHQEFTCSQTYRMTGRQHSSQSVVIIDVSSGKWRERSGTRVATIFNGRELFRIEEGGGEVVRTTPNPKEPLPQPYVYDFSDSEPSKAVELERRSCNANFSGNQCVVLELPIKQRTRLGADGQMITNRGGVRRLMIDIETGLLVSSGTAEGVDNQRNGYQLTTAASLNNQVLGNAVDPEIFQPAHDLREVKRFSDWDAARIRKQFAGKPAPELTVTDVAGNSLALSGFQGKTVLLDFWATWCPPCRWDVPALETLHRKYHDRGLVIVGLSFGESRETVEQFLKKSAPTYPIVLTSENQMPRVYQPRVIPTYIVIGSDGAVVSATEGDQGFAELRKLLKHAGMDTD